MAETLDRPTTVEGEYSCWLPRHRRSPGVARLLLRTFLGGFADGERFAEAGELLLSELVTNAVEHARVPAGRLVKVAFALRAERLRVEVHDAAPQRPELRPVPVQPDAEAGRGLLLVRELSDRWGCCPRAGGTGKFVWFECAPAGRSGAGDGAATSDTDAATPDGLVTA
ncbi:ATP-binding protein [Kitasatospora indigofera]|uniref:ATP-binding protein n=1 Tax=Kitasatospora indigofera TaxID=67307 RepID=UPI0033A0634A